MPSQRGLVVQSFWELRSFPLVPLDPLLFMLASFLLRRLGRGLCCLLRSVDGRGAFRHVVSARPRSHRVEFFVYYHGFGYAAGFSEGFGGTEIGAGRISQ